MLSPEENEILTHVGPGTLMGDLLRQYWAPALLSSEVPTPDCPPVRVRLLGENLIAFRTTSGQVGLIQDACPHRAASFFFGRNEEGGLRCAYHGWKFDVQGNCLEMPNEREESNFRHKVKIKVYRGADFGGMVWAYMGPHQDDPPEVPRFEWGLVPEEQRRHYRKIVYQCNWAQALEGEMDSTHVYFLHRRLRPEDPPKYGLYNRDLAARFHVRDSELGLTYGAERTEENGNTYWRTTHFLFPIYGMFPGDDYGTTPLSIYVPIDDEHTLHMGVQWHPSKPIPGSRRPDGKLADEPGVLVDGVGPMKPEQRGKFFAHWWPEANPDTDFLMDPWAKKHRNFTGIPSVRLQDAAVIHSMGPIMDRTQEHLGTSDLMVIRLRQMLLNHARRLRDHGEVPPAVDNPEVYAVRSGGVVLPNGINGIQATLDLQQGRVKPEDFELAVPATNYGV
jgi:phthalate 4,5-dioxygenase